MQKLIAEFVQYLKYQNNSDVAETLQGVATELTNVHEAFALGRALQNIQNLEVETSNSGFSEKEIEQVIEYVNENLTQAKY